jgi:nitronate monooxygenase
MIVDSSAKDIVHTNLITGVHGNYLKPSIRNAGMDPDALPTSDPTKMDFGSDRQKPKAWKEIWGCGQGIGVLRDVPPAGELVARLAREYDAARREWAQRVLPEVAQAA